MAVMGRPGEAHVLWDADVLCKRLEPFWQTLSVTEKAYGHQTAILLKVNNSSRCSPVTGGKGGLGRVPLVAVKRGLGETMPLGEKWVAIYGRRRNTSVGLLCSSSLSSWITIT